MSSWAAAACYTSACSTSPRRSTYLLPNSWGEGLTTAIDHTDTAILVLADSDVLMGPYPHRAVP